MASVVSGMESPEAGAEFAERAALAGTDACGAAAVAVLWPMTELSIKIKTTAEQGTAHRICMKTSSLINRGMNHTAGVRVPSR